MRGDRPTNYRDGRGTATPQPEHAARLVGATFTLDDEPTRQRPTPFRPFAFLIPTVALTGVAWHRGWVDVLVAADPTYLTQAIVVLTACGLGLASWKHWRVLGGLDGMSREQVAVYIGGVRHLAGALVLLGLIGTVIGFIMALSGVDPQAAGDVRSVAGMVATLVEGMSVALYTTLAGAIGNLILMLAYRMLLVRPATDMLAGRG